MRKIRISKSPLRLCLWLTPLIAALSAFLATGNVQAQCSAGPVVSCDQASGNAVLSLKDINGNPLLPFFVQGQGQVALAHIGDVITINFVEFDIPGPPSTSCGITNGQGFLIYPNNTVTQTMGN